MNIAAKTKPKKENILTHWSEAQAGSNDEKSWVLKISLDCPFNVQIKGQVLLKWAKNAIFIIIFPVKVGAIYLVQWCMGPCNWKQHWKWTEPVVVVPTWGLAELVL